MIDFRLAYTNEAKEEFKGLGITPKTSIRLPFLPSIGHEFQAHSDWDLIFKVDSIVTNVDGKTTLWLDSENS